MKRKRRRVLLVQILALTVIPLTLLLLVLVFSAQSLHLTAIRRLVGERDERAARAAATAIAHQLRDRLLAVNTVSLQAIAIGDSAHALADATYLLPEFDAGLAQFAADGSLMRTSQPSAMWDGEVVRAEIDKLVQAEGAASLANSMALIPDSATGENILIVSGKMDDGSVTAGATSLEKLVEQALGDVFDPSDQASAFIVDENYRLLYQIGPSYWAEEDLPDHPAVIQALGGKRGATYLDQGKEERISAFSPISGMNWALVIEEPWQSVADPVLEATELIPFVLVPALVVALVAIVFGFRQIVQPLQTLERRAAQVTVSDFEAIEERVGGISEIQKLQLELIRMAHRADRAQRSLRDYLGAVTTAQEEERSRVARDLHDDTIQSLVALTRKAQLTRISLDGRPEADQLGEIEKMSAGIVDGLRRIARDLRPVYLEELGLAPALKMLAQDTGVILKIPIAFKMSGEEQRLSRDAELALYRITQEALSNVSRHARASRAEVGLDFALETVTLSVNDDGCGFDMPNSPAEMAPAGHFGLQGMHERAELIGGNLTIKSLPEHGTSVEVKLTLDDG